MNKILTFALAGLVLVSVGCKKDEKAVTPPTIASSANISGVVKAETDTTNAILETQSNVNILAIFNKIDLVLNPVAGQTYPDVTVSVLTDADGKYSLNIPTNGKTVNVTLKPQDFLSPVVTGPTTTSPDQLFTSSQQTLSINEKEKKIIDINY